MRIFQRGRLHEVLLVVRVLLLVARRRDVLFGEEVVVRMVALPRLLLALPRYAGLLLLPRVPRRLLAPAQLLGPVEALLLQVRVLLLLGLVEPVDDGVLALGDVDALDLGSLEGGHGMGRGGTFFWSLKPT
jgi:hypothetical protein